MSILHKTPPPEEANLCRKNHHFYLQALEERHLNNTQHTIGLQQPPPDNRNPDTLDLRPVCFPFWMAKQIALDLEEKHRLETELQLLELQLQAQASLVLGLEEKEKRRLLQLKLLNENLHLLEIQLEGERTKAKQKSSQWIWVLRLLAALGSGFVLGRI